MGYYWAFLLLPAFFGSCSGNCGEPPRLDYGTLDSAYLGRDNFSVGENVSYSCQPGYITAPGTRKVITCLSTSAWSTPDVFCTRRSCGIPEDTANGQVHINDTLFGSRVYYTCNVGYNMINKVNYRDCLADGTWSGAPPACEVQTCPPPFAITDGSFEPNSDEYNYLDSVTYKCNNSSLSLIGEKSISCTAHGNWSSDPPKCKVVECKSPDVANSEKLSGFTGPYNLNSAVSFKCVSGYTMSGASSVRCNVSSEWDPPLPTCSKIVTQSPTTTTTTTTTTKAKETESGGTTVSQKPSTTKKKDENNGEIVTQSPTTTTTTTTTTKAKETESGGGGSGAIVGNTVIIFTMAIMAFVLNLGF